MKRLYLQSCGIFLLYIVGWLWLILDPASLRAPALRNPCFILLIDSTLFLVGLIWLRPPRPITFWKPAIYLALIVSISVLFSMAPVELVNTFRGACFILEWAFFTVVNVYLWEALFKVTTRRKWEVSILIGFVNAAVCILSIPVIKG